MLLFIVEDVFDITGRGIILVPGISFEQVILTGAKIKLVKPDKSELITTIKGIEFGSSRGKYKANRPIIIGKEFTKSDVLIGTEVWLIK